MIYTLISYRIARLRATLFRLSFLNIKIVSCKKGLTNSRTSFNLGDRLKHCSGQIGEYDSHENPLRQIGSERKNTEKRNGTGVILLRLKRLVKKLEISMKIKS